MDTSTAAESTAPSTTLGTPASPKWEPEWLAEVDRVETELGHRICGAHTPAWTPCKLTSTHPNGRCRFHGGAPGIGAPNGNPSGAFLPPPIIGQKAASGRISGRTEDHRRPRAQASDGS